MAFAQAWKVQAVALFRLLHGHAEIPSGYVVPPDAPWPTSMHGLPLGAILTNAGAGVCNPTDMASAVPPLGRATAAPTPSKRRASTSRDKRCKRARVGGELDESLRTGPITRRKQAALDALGVASATSSDEETDSTPPTPRSVESDGEFKSDDSESTASASSSDDDDTPLVDRAAGKKQPRIWSWEDKIDALCVFRNEHGHVNVHWAFRVPASPAYSPHLHGMALGTIVGNIRNRWTLLTPARLRDLDALGFRWRLNERGYSYTTCEMHPTNPRLPRHQFVSWQSQIDALLTYRRLHGDLEIPDDFFVPSSAEWPSAMHNIELKCVLPVLRMHVYELPTDYEDRLHRPESGLMPDIPNFDTFLRLVEIYRDTVGSGAVARDFDVPPSGGNWIDAWRGLNLGDLAWSVGLNMAALTCHKRALLEATGFVFNSAATWHRIVVGLRTFCLVHGAASVPTAFVVPSLPAWPTDLHGMRLGHYVDVMTSARTYRLLPAATVAAIDAIGTREEDNGALEPAATSSGPVGASPAPPMNGVDEAAPTSTTLAAASLTTAHDAPTRATDESEAAPASADDTKSLGNDDASDDDDDTMGFDDGGIDVQDDENDIEPAAVTGCSGDSAPPTSVRIGTAPVAVVDSSVAPPRSVAAMTPVGSPAHQEPLPAGANEPDAGAQLASRFESPELSDHVDDQSTPMLLALATFKTLYHHLDVPQDFVIEATEPWPASVHSLQLGNVVMSLRLLTPTCLAPWIVARLTTLGFEWTPLRFDSVDGATQRLAAEFPAHPPTSFVVPAQSPWPQDLWDADLLPLGAKRDAWLAVMEIQYGASLALLLGPSARPPAPTSKRVYPVQLVLQCIEVYHALHDQKPVPLLFHVPLRDAKWPAAASLMPLGLFVWAARDQWANLDPLVRAAISAFGLSPDVFAADNDDAIDADVGAVEDGDQLNDRDIAGPVNDDPRDENNDLANEAVVMDVVPAVVAADPALPDAIRPDDDGAIDARDEPAAPRQVYRPALPPVLSDGLDWPLLLGALSWYFIVQEHSDVPAAYVTEGNVPLGDLVRQIRQGHVLLRRERLEALDRLDFDYSCVMYYN